jgi:hypothetical protein
VILGRRPSRITATATAAGLMCVSCVPCGQLGMLSWRFWLRRTSSRGRVAGG